MPSTLESAAPSLKDLRPFILDLLKFQGVVGIAAALLVLGMGACVARTSTTAAGPTPQAKPWPTYTDALPAASFNLDTLQRRTFNYFWELVDGYGQTPDRWPREQMSSIAATGFYLPALAVGVSRGYVTRAEAAARARFTLQTLYDLPQGKAKAGVSGYRGLFYHFLNHEDGLRFRNSELSTIDTGLLMAGVLAAGEFFDGDSSDERAIRQLAEQLYRRVEWDFAWMQDGKLSMGWRPDKGFLPARWRGYNEASILLILAMGSPTHPIPDTAWQAWTRTYDWGSGYGSKEHVMFDPLFGHQYSQMFIDFRGIQDAYMRERGIDYFENSVRASELQHAYAKLNPRGWKAYGSDLWGLTACDGPGGEPIVAANGDVVKVHSYWARGVDGTVVKDDATVAPTAAGGSYPFTPEASHRALAHMWTTYQPWLVGRYGFRDAFNLEVAARADQAGAPGWFDSDYLGIDQGPILLQIENYRSGLVWDLLKDNEHIRRGLSKAGFMGGWLESPNQTSNSTQ